MPNIQEYDAGPLALRPTETGVEARAGTARRIGMFYNQKAGAEQMLAGETERLGAQTAKLGSETAALGDLKGSLTADVGRRIGSSISDAGDAAVKYLNHQQISHGSAALADLMLQSNQEWQDTLKKSDPNDPSIAKNFLEGLDAKLAKFKNDGFYTEDAQKWAEGHADAFHQHMIETTIGDMSKRAGDVALVNDQQATNANSANVHNNPTQSNLDFVLASQKNATEASIANLPGLTGAQVGTMRTERNQKSFWSIINSAAIGYVAQNGTLPPWINDKKYAPYINGAELKQFEQAAKVQQRADLAAKKSIEESNYRLGVIKGKTAIDDVYSKTTSISPDGKLIIDGSAMQKTLDVLRANPLAADASKAQFGMIERYASGVDKASDKAALRDVDARMFDVNNPTTMRELKTLYGTNQMSESDFTRRSGLVTELEKGPFTDPIYKHGLDAVGNMFGNSEKGKEKYELFLQSIQPKMASLNRADKLTAKDVNTDDPNSLIMQTYKRFELTPEEKMQALVEKVARGFPIDPEAMKAITGAANPTSAVKPTSTARAVDGVPVPNALNGVAALQLSKDHKRWRDSASGKVYDLKGNEIEQ